MIYEENHVFYTTDLMGKDRRELSQITDPRIMNGVYHDGWAYYTVYNTSGTYADCKTDLERKQFLNDKTLRRFNMETGEDRLVCSSLAYYCVTADGIFYTVYESEPREMSYNDDTYYDIFAGKLYHSNADGSGADLLCTLEGVDLSVYTGQLFLGYTNGKLALSFMEKVENEFYESGYDYNISRDVIIVDTGNGSWEVSRSGNW